VIAMSEISQESIAAVDALLGRPARGLRNIPVTDENGAPRVIQVASLVENKPFPTLFWLVDPVLNYRIDQLEARGLIAELQQRIDESETLQDSMRKDHEAHIALRNELMQAQDRSKLEQQGYFESLQKRGIGGIENFSRIRCLHTWYAAHLVEANTVGQLLDEVFAQK